MPEVSNCEIYKLQSKVAELESLAKRLKDQLKDWEEVKFISGNPKQGMSLDDDQLDAIKQSLERP